MAVEHHDFTLYHTKSTPSATLLPHRKFKTAPPFITTPNHHHNHNHRSPPQEFSTTTNFELLSFKPLLPSTDSYTSLKDILPSPPSSILSPTPSANHAGVSSSSSGSGYEISIRNRLVKQAAWAYLQPAVLSSPSSSSQRICFSGEIFRPMINEFRRVVSETVSSVYDWLVDALWLILCR